MYRSIIFTLLITFAAMTGYPQISCAAQAENDDNSILVTINGNNSSTQDFKDWWANWREPGMKFPDSPDPYIDWLLLSNEAKRMNLDTAPRFKTKISTFLKTRALMYLKNEEVDSKFDFSEKKLREIYQKEYTPRRLFQFIYYISKESADGAYDDIKQKKITIEELHKLTPEKGGPSVIQEKLLRPKDIRPEWQDTAYNLKVNQNTKPLPFGKGFLILRLKEITPGDDEDYQKAKRIIRDESRKQQQGVLTRDLIKQLRVKYNVVVDKDFLKNLDIENVSAEIADRNILTSSVVNVSVKRFADKAVAIKKQRQKTGFKEMDADEFNDYILNNIIVHSLITHESLERHYELKPPLKPSYDFYYGHRLIKELEYRLFEKETTVNEDEISAYYNEHLKEYSSPVLLTFAEAKGDEDKIQKIWIGIITGGDFYELAEKHLGYAPKNQTIPIDHLSAETLKIIDSLAENEVSAPAKIKDTNVTYKYIGRQPSVITPKESVSKKISDIIHKQKLEKSRNNFLDVLKDKSKISINKKAWKKLKNELGEK